MDCRPLAGALMNGGMLDGWYLGGDAQCRQQRVLGGEKWMADSPPSGWGTEDRLTAGWLVPRGEGDAVEATEGPGGGEVDGRPLAGALMNGGMLDG